jgi:hypothetical protein
MGRHEEKQALRRPQGSKRYRWGDRRHERGNPDGGQDSDETMIWRRWRRNRSAAQTCCAGSDASSA